MGMLRPFLQTGVLCVALLVFVASFLMATPAKADVPLAARLLAEPYVSTGIRVNIANLGSQMRGLANDGNTVYAMNQSGNIVSVNLSSIDDTPGQAIQNVNGTVHTVGWGQDGAPSMPSLDTLSLAYSNDCIFITNSSNSEGNIKLYCINVTDYSVTEIAVPGANPLPEGYYYVTSSLIDFPDGRIGKVSKYTQQGPNYYTSTLRTYTVTGTGENATVGFSKDYIMKDTDTVYTDAAGWARDEHGIATDGTYLYRIQWNSIVPNTKVWALADSAEAEVVYGGSYTQPFSNMHYLSHNHKDNYYLMGHFWGTEFFITTAADPGPGPGNPLIPTFGSITRTTDGYTVQITNYDAAFNWAGIATAGGTATISGTGLLTVTGLAPSTSSTVTVTVSRTGFPNGQAPVTGTSLDPPPDDGDGISRTIENAGPNSGDGNNDGTADSEQKHVSSFVNSATNTYATLAVNDDCTITAISANAERVNAMQDGSYNYPAGLMDFALDCGTPGYTTAVIQYYYGDYAENLVLRKYNPSTKRYTGIPGATISRQTIDGQPVIIASYSITDGGELDTDGAANGTITDPAGPAVLSATANTTKSGSLANTGLHIAVVASLAACFTATALFVARKKRA